MNKTVLSILVLIFGTVVTTASAIYFFQGRVSILSVLAGTPAMIIGIMQLLQNKKGP